ncbi:CMRF35-like molecule 5 [Grammomys surdaster]|uniref:CMRF35-like molecule 5 n=1 Tax=Grammomys surdaster TaxID=491861 RepID=UPI00109F50EE|nr:CMRF35-like molecule 5 [Grammomys surdaster]
MAGKAAYLFSAILLLLLASGSWAQDPQVLRALEGQTVSVKCRYNLSYSFNEKIWCKQISEDTCQPLVPSVSTGAEKLRFSIQDSWLKFFTVVMTELKMSDSGVYYCGIAENRRKIAFLGSIHLVVSKGSQYPPNDTTTTRSVPKSPAVVSSPDPGVTDINGTVPGRPRALCPRMEEPVQSLWLCGCCHHLYRSGTTFPDLIFKSVRAHREPAPHIPEKEEARATLTSPHSEPWRTPETRTAGPCPGLEFTPALTSLWTLQGLWPLKE